MPTEVPKKSSAAPAAAVSSVAGTLPDQPAAGRRKTYAAPCLGPAGDGRVLGAGDDRRAVVRDRDRDAEQVARGAAGDGQLRRLRGRPPAAPAADEHVHGALPCVAVDGCRRRPGDDRRAVGRRRQREAEPIARAAAAGAEHRRLDVGLGAVPGKRRARGLAERSDAQQQNCGRSARRTLTRAGSASPFRGRRRSTSSRTRSPCPSAPARAGAS